MISYPPSLELARLPTPLTALERLSRRLGCELRCKRDDLTGVAMSGNKTRKLEFLFAEALARGAGGVITCGAAQSNHTRATALAAARLGLGCRLLLRTDEPKAPPEPGSSDWGGNLLLAQLAGAAVEWVDAEAYAEDRDRLMAERAEELAGVAGGAPWYVIPEGGSNGLGAWGYVRCVEEIEAELGSRPLTIVYPVGSGGTAAGLLAGCRLLGLPYRPIGVCVGGDASYFRARIAAILDEMAARFGVDVAVDGEGIELWDEYVGPGYGQASDEQLDLIAEVARLEGLVTDPVYSGKALYGLARALQDRRGGSRRLGEPVVFIHTGGIFGLFAHREALATAARRVAERAGE